ncbi:MAG: 1-deoxy-D-xylulose-5-phosphate reductoisomerase [Oscillospiraceae bacterium]|nr:1-deoxy-D-xylulose-5-phosphate reductoisomerase [Oscillospiraceae bacterium]
MKTISILGSTGSIGRQTIEAAQHLSLRVAALAGNRNTALLEEQARRLHPALLAVWDESNAKDLRIALADTPVRVVSGMDGLMEAAVLPEAEAVVTAVSGSVGLQPTLCAIREKKRICLANKETLVCAGELVMAEAAKQGAEILPVDSEHSAIFQCLDGHDPKEVKKLLLTASGGPFRGKKLQEVYYAAPEDALAHPNWSMGAKISVDSATMMNKGLEFIEAMHLFGVTPEQIEVLIHPESVIHSMVEYTDGSVLAQCGTADMRLPIQYALTYPARMPSLAGSLDFAKLASLHFMAPDLENTPCLALAIDCAKRGGNLPAAMSAANELAVSRFLNRELPFGAIYECVAAALDSIDIVENPTLDALLETDRAAREAAVAFQA